MPPDNQSYCYAKENHMQSIEPARLSWAMCVCYEQGLVVHADSKIGQSQAFI
jgi:hypothetical protein